MATVYSLVCWGGRLGKTVTLTIASPCVVTSTNHGLLDGTRLVFSTTGALPTGITAGTTYYAKSTADNTFNLYTDAALTSIVNTSGTQSGTHTAKSVLMAEYFAQYAGRWGSSGSERCYDGLVSWNSGRASASSLDKEVCEIGEAFTEAMASTLTLTMPAGATEITTKVNGAYSPAYHFGVVGAGYKLTRPPASGTPSVITVGALFNVLLDGFTVASSAKNSYHIYGFVIGFGSRAQKMISIGQFNGYGFGAASTSGSEIDMCLCIGWIAGIYYAAYQNRPLVTNCTLVGNTNGIGVAATTNINAYIYNTVSIGNTVNWPAPTTGTRVGANNAGLSDGAGGYTGGTPWGDAPVAGLTSDFVDLVGTGTAPNWTIPPNYALAAGSTLIDAGVEFYGVSLSDIANAEVPNYNNGGAEAVDIGCYEFDHGFGLHPSSDARGLAFTGLVAGSKVKVFLTGTDTEKFSASSSGTSETWSENVAGSVTVDYTIQKAGFLPIRVTGITVTASPIGAQTVPISQVVARWYQASSGLTLNTNCFANSGAKKFGLTTATTVQNLASYLLEQWIALGDTGEAFANQAFPLEANGPNSFTWLYGWEADLSTYANTISNLSRDGMRYLNTSGTMTAAWCALLSAGVPSGLTVRYQQVEGNAPTSAAVTGNIDQLVQIYGDSTHGSFDYRGYMVAKVQAEGYDQAEVDVVGQYGTLEDQLYVIALLPSQNGVAADNPPVSSVTITDHGASPVTWNSKAFSITITDSGTTSGEDIMQWIRHAEAAGGAFQGKNAFNWHDLVQTNGDKFKGVRGSLYGDTGATLKGVRVLRGSSAHPDFTIHTSDDGSVVSTTPPAQATATVLADSRIQLYNVTTSAELDNAFVTGTTYANTLASGVSVGDTLRLRVCKLGYNEAESFAVWTAAGCQFLVSQSESEVYAAFGIDGSTVTEYTLDVTGAIEIDANDVDGVSTKARLGAFYNYALTTANGIRYAYGAMTFLSSAAIRINVDVIDLRLENINATTALKFSDLSVRLFRSDGSSVIAESSYSIHNDYSGVPDVVETGVSGLTGSESAQLMGLPSASAVVAALQSTTIPVDTRKMNGSDIIGDGSEVNPWRGVGVQP